MCLASAVHAVAPHYVAVIFHGQAIAGPPRIRGDSRQPSSRADVRTNNGHRQRRLLSTPHLMKTPMMCVWCLAVLLAASPAPGRAGEAAEGAVEMVPTNGAAGAPPESSVPTSGAAPRPRGPGGMMPWGGMPGRSGMYGMFSPQFGFGPRPLMAMAMLMANEMAAGDKPEAAAGSAETAADSEGVGGVLELQDLGSHVVVSGNITGLAAGMYSLMVHRSGDMRRGCGGLGMMDPYRQWRGSAFLAELGSVMADGSDSATMVRVMSPGVSLTGPRGALGRALVIQKMPDMNNPNMMGPGMMGPGMMGSGMMGSGMMGSGMMGAGMMGSGMPSMPMMACGVVMAL